MEEESLIALLKIWSWLKRYWYIPLVAVLSVFLYIATRGKSDLLSKALRAAQVRRRRDLDKIRELESERQEEKGEAANERAESLDKVREESRDRVEANKEAVEGYHRELSRDDNDSLAKRVAKEYDFKIGD